MSSWVGWLGRQKYAAELQWLKQFGPFESLMNSAGAMRNTKEFIVCKQLFDWFYKYIYQVIKLLFYYQIKSFVYWRWLVRVGKFGCFSRSVVILICIVWEGFVNRRMVTIRGVYHISVDRVFLVNLLPDRLPKFHS